MVDKIKRLQEFEKCIKYDEKLYKFNIIDVLNTNYNSTYFTQISIFDDIDRGTIKKDKTKVKKLIDALIRNNKKEKEELLKDFSDLEKRAIGSMLGMAIGDAMGSRLEFYPHIPQAQLTSNQKIEDIGIFKREGNKIFGLPDGHFNLLPGQWTDDTSMGLCLADSLLVNEGKLDRYDLMNRFLAWWNWGYNNAFRFNTPPRHSVGLGGNISLSFRKYIEKPVEETEAGDKNTSGNGSIMRNAAIPICFHYDIKKACEKAKEQSLSTHQGIQAKECCSILTYIVFKILNGEELKVVLNKLKEEDKILDVKKNNEDYGECSSAYNNVKCLINSNNKDNHGENWNWKDGIYEYNQRRAEKQPGYIGSYAMDNLAMSLNIVYHTNSFKEAIIKAVNLRGDSDSVASVVGQIAGAAYPLESIPNDWIEAINKWDDGEIALRGYMLSRLHSGDSYYLKKPKKPEEDKKNQK